MNNALLIISIPFARNARVILLSPLFAKLKQQYNILIVSPLADSKKFTKEFAAPSVSFVKLNTDPPSGRLLSSLYRLAEWARVNGYYYKYRNRNLQYYARLTFFDTKSEKQSLAPAIRNIAKRIFAALASNSKLWRLIDSLTAKRVYNTKRLDQATEGYRNVIVMQVANWSYQAKCLAYFARRHCYKSILVPYTTDQLTINGFLINEFDYIFAQGAVEFKYAEQYHQQEKSKIIKLGMLWLRVLDKYLNEQVEPSSKPLTLLFAGVSSDYYPRINEMATLKYISEAMALGKLPKLKIIYRPVTKSAAEVNTIKQQLRHLKHISIQLPEQSMIGMEVGTSQRYIEDEVRTFVKSIQSADILLMSRTTTLLFDFLYLGKPVLFNFMDETNSLESKQINDVFIPSDPLGIFSVGIPIIRNKTELIDQIRHHVAHPIAKKSIQHDLKTAWDYANHDYLNIFMTKIGGLLHEH